MEFFTNNKIPFWGNANALIGNTSNDNTRYCFAKPAGFYVVYLASAGTSELDLGAEAKSFTVSWFNPRTGGHGGASLSQGSWPSGPRPSAGRSGPDWVVLVKAK